MKHKILMSIAILTAALMSAGTVLADTLVMNAAVLKGNEVTISGKLVDGKQAGIKNRPVTVEVVKPGGKQSQLADIFRIDEPVTSETAGSEGTFSLLLRMEDYDDGGIYKVYLKGRDIDLVEQEFVYISMSSRHELIEEVKSCTTKAEIDSLFADENTKVILAGLGISTQRFDAILDKGRKAIYDFILSDSYDLDSFADALNELFALGELNTAYEERPGGGKPIPKEVFLNNAEIIGIPVDKDSLWVWLGNSIDGIVETVLKNKEYSSIKAVYNAYMEAGVVRAFSTAAYHQMEGLIKICGDYLQLDLTYGGDKTKKDEVLKKMVGTYTSSDGIRKQFSDAVKAANEKKSEPSRGGGGGGGYSVTVPPVTEEKPTETSIENKKTPEFTDLGDAPWAEAQIKTLAKKGIVDGDGSGRFYPNDAMKREEFVKMAVAAFGLYIEDAVSKFTDVDNEKWYAPYVASAHAAGMVAGNDDGSFGVGEMVSRQDVAVMIYRILNEKGIELEHTRGIEKFSDQTEISVYAQKGIESLYRAEILNGMGNGAFEPKASTTKAQAAVMIAAVLERISQIEA